MRGSVLVRGRAETREVMEWVEGLMRREFWYYSKRQVNLTDMHTHNLYHIVWSPNCHRTSTCTHAHAHTHTHSYKHILYTQQVELRVWELEGKSLLISGFQSCLCLSFHWHSHGFSSLLPSSLPPYTHFLYCYWWTQTQLQLNAVQTVTHMWGMPHINMWRDRKKVRGGRGKRRWGEEYSWVQTMQVVHQGGEMKKWVC